MRLNSDIEITGRRDRKMKRTRAPRTQTRERRNRQEKFAPLVSLAEWKVLSPRATTRPVLDDQIALVALLGKKGPLTWCPNSYSHIIYHICRSEETKRSQLSERDLKGEEGLTVT